MRVLVESSFNGNDLWRPDYEGTVVAETPERYQVEKWYGARQWVPKDGLFLRCREIKELK